MKNFYALFIFIVLTVNSYFTQNVNLVYDFDSTKQVAIFPYPNDNSKIVCLQDTTFDSNQQQWSSGFNLLSISTSAKTKLSFPSISKILVKPITFNGKIIFAAETTSQGIELVLFDGTNSTIIDIEPGQDSSIPSYSTVDNVLYIIAKKGSKRQLFKMKNDFTLEQITQETTADVYQCVYENGTKIFYTTKTSNFDNTISLKSIDVSNQSVSLIFNKKGSYLSKTICFNNLYLGALHDNSFDLYAVKNDNIFASVFSDSTQNGFGVEMFTFENKLYLFHISGRTLFQSLNGTSFSTIFTLDNEHVFKEVILKNNTCQFIVDKNADYSLSLYNLNNDQMSLVYTSDQHGHYLTEKDEFRYFVLMSENYTPLQPTAFGKLLQMNILTNTFQLFTISDSSSHGPFSYGNHNGDALWINNTIYFLYGNIKNHSSFDIYTFETTLGINEVSNNISDYTVFPNPLHGNILTIESSNSEMLSIYSLDGKSMHQQLLSSGRNELENIKDFIPGVYIINLGGRTKKLTIY